MIENQIIINSTPVQIKEYHGQRVVTLKDIDTVHGRPDGTAGRNFRTNKVHFIKGEDYFTIELTTDEIRRQFGASKNAGKDMNLITESGYLMLVKSFTDELAWIVQRQLVNSYFRAKEIRPVDSYMIDDPVKRAERWIEEQKARQALEIKVSEQAQEIEVMQPKAFFADSVAASDDTILVRDLAKILKQNGVKTGEKRLYAWLRDNGYIMQFSTMPTQKAMNMGLFIIKESTRILPDGKSKLDKVTRVTGKGQQYFINKGKDLKEMDGER